MAKQSLINQYSTEELQIIAKQVNTWKDLMLALGYVSSSGSQLITIKSRIVKENIDISHFSMFKKEKIERNRENVFIENSTASQKTLRRFYHKENIPYVCSICRQEPFWNGQELTLILDHINGKNHDDRLENLRWVCPNCNMQLPTTNRAKSSFEEKSQKKYYCLDCGKEISSRSAQRCASCAQKVREKVKKDKEITREELKNLIRTLPFTRIGEMYNVSDNAIRKWCDYYNLPRRASEIKQYSDEEWLQI